MRRFIYILLLCCGTITMMAQDEAIHAKVRVWSEAAGTKEYATLQYALFRTAGKAQRNIPALQEALSRMNGMGGTLDAEAWQKVCKERKIKFRKSNEKGEFKVRGYGGMALLVSTYDPDNDMSSDGARFAVITLKNGQTDYDYIFKKKVSEGTHEIGNVDVFGQSRDTASIVAMPAMEDDRYVYFKVHVELPAGYVNEKSRLVIQPVAVDCETEDTVDYIPGLVMEGVKFHELQNKRMRFNYMKNDKVAFAFVNKPLWSDEKVYLDTTLVYTKRDPKKSYRIPYSIEIADLTHISYKKNIPGPQNSKDIYKFIELGIDTMLMTPKEKAARIKTYNIFKKDFVKYAMHQLTPSREKEVADAIDEVFSWSPVNRAALYTEARDILNIPYSENLELINALDDANPKKWYLRGIIEADKEEKVPGVKPKDYIPEYLCYFYVSFELDPSYKWLYFKDGQISDELRAKYRYDKHNLVKYRLMFYNKVAKNKETPVEIKKKTDDEEIEVSGE